MRVSTYSWRFLEDGCMLRFYQFYSQIFGAFFSNDFITSHLYILYSFSLPNVEVEWPTYIDLFGLILRCHLFIKYNFWINFRSSLRRMRFISVKFLAWAIKGTSFAYMNSLEDLSTMSTMYVLNSNGESTEPCGSPLWRHIKRLCLHWEIRGFFYLIASVLYVLDIDTTRPIADQKNNILYLKP